MPLETILIVEDDHDIRVTLRETLEAEGYYVFSAGNGKDGIEALKRIKPPGLILLDLMMPIASGWDFLAAKATDITIAAIPVIVMSAAGNSTKVNDVQVMSFLPKPIDIEPLLKEVKRYCGVPVIQPRK